MPTAVGAAATFAPGAADECTVAGVMGVPVGGAFVGGGVGVHAGRAVGLAVAVGVAGALPSSGLMTCDVVAVGGSAVGDGEGVPVAGVPVAGVFVGSVVGVTHAGVLSVAAPAVLTDQPITTARMPVMMAVASTAIPRHPYVVCPCITTPS